MINEIKKVVVAEAIRKEDLSIPEEFKEAVDVVLKNSEMTDETFLACSRLAIQFKEKYPEKRMGIAYHMAGIWLLATKRNRLTPLIEEIGYEFGQLELPDHHITPSVDEGWKRVADLIRRGAGSMRSCESKA